MNILQIYLIGLSCAAFGGFLLGFRAEASSVVERLFIILITISISLISAGPGVGVALWVARNYL